MVVSKLGQGRTSVAELPKPVTLLKRNGLLPISEELWSAWELLMGWRKTVLLWCIVFANLKS